MTMKRFTMAAVVFLLCGTCCCGGESGAVSDLRLVPFPKRVLSATGEFALDRSLTLQTSERAGSPVIAIIVGELKRCGLPEPAVESIDSDTFWLRLAPTRGDVPAPSVIRDQPTQEDYALSVGPQEIVGMGAGEAGLFYGAQTLSQLIRANRRDNRLPCLCIRDWPSLRWRCFQDDMTRGPSSTLDTLRFEADWGAHLKMNLFTYYMEYQYAFKKHPSIGPADGSLEPDDLAALVKSAKRRHVDVLGNQQSFGHFARILAHEEYAHLRETPSLLCPVNEESYKLLDDLYSEVCPLLPFEMFNVCCDETWGLGTGPSKDAAERDGVGAVYVNHVRRIHDLLKGKYNKRMMMWGDIILQHPEHLDKIPQDTVMLTWGYGPRESFEDQILPFANSGYEFFVCPGVSNWSRILPDFAVTETNIHHFVRDGAAHGAIGMLNTAWEDDGEALNGPKWHGYAWGAECAWNASATTPEAFNARIGAVLFGEAGDHFGQAIGLLGRTHRLADMQGMNNRRFWADDFLPQSNPKHVRETADRLLELVRPAIGHLLACQAEATVNGELLDYFLFGARRMERIGQRMLDGLAAVETYAKACDAPAPEAVALVKQVEKLVLDNRDVHRALGDEFARLWLAESKPYALDWTMDRYAARVAWFDDLAARVTAARQAAESGNPLPPPDEIGLAMPEAFARRTRPHAVSASPLKAERPWCVDDATCRLGLTIEAGKTPRSQLPVEVDLRLPDGLHAESVRAVVLDGAESPTEIPAQIAHSPTAGLVRLILIMPEVIPANGEAHVHVYFVSQPPAQPATWSVSTSDGPDGMKWIENEQVRLLLGPEGGHVYRWEVKDLDHRDLTMPGTAGWAGFSDMAQGHRGTPHRLECLAAGPAVVRYRCSDPTGLEKTTSVYAGVSWIEVVLSSPTGHYWDFDNPINFAADGPSPGEYLFSNGATGPVGRQADGVPAQVKANGVRWGIKYNAGQLALGIATPEVAAHHVIAPGAGAGGVGIESSPPANHFITFAGVLDGSPRDLMQQLTDTLNFRNQPRVTLSAIQQRP